MSFAGSQVSFQAFFPNLQTALTQLSVRQVDRGAEFRDIATLRNPGGASVINADINVSERLINYRVDNAGGEFTTTDFNGYVFRSVGSEDFNILSVKIVRRFNTLGIDADNVTFDSNGIRINVSGLRFEDGDAFRLRVRFDELGTGAAATLHSSDEVDSEWLESGYSHAVTQEATALFSNLVDAALI